MRFLSVKRAVVKKFGFFKRGDPDFYVHRLAGSCSCGAPMLCVCHRSNDKKNDILAAAHFCLNGACREVQRITRLQTKRFENPFGIGFCPICWRDLDK